MLVADNHMLGAEIQDGGRRRAARRRDEGGITPADLVRQRGHCAHHGQDERHDPARWTANGHREQRVAQCMANG